MKNKIRNKMRQLRKQKGVSQTFISSALGYKYTSGYANIEMGRTELKLDQARIIADILGCNVLDLLEDEDFFSKKVS